jgi:hypothetical protein
MITKLFTNRCLYCSLLNTAIQPTTVNITKCGITFCQLYISGILFISFSISNTINFSFSKFGHSPVNLICASRPIGRLATEGKNLVLERLYIASIKIKNFLKSK